MRDQAVAGAPRFADRRAAGRELGRRLAELALPNPVVIGLLRGGVPVAYEVAQSLAAPLDVLVVRKVGAPGNPELGIGAVAEGDVRVFNDSALSALLVSVEELDAAVARARQELAERVQRYRGSRAPIDVTGRTAIVVDDGLATGGTARAALHAVRARGPSALVLAVPVGAPDAVSALAADADQIVCLIEPEPMHAVGLWYEQFEQTSDAEIDTLLAGSPGDPAPPLVIGPRSVSIPVGSGQLIVGDLMLPYPARGLVVFAHGSGSSRHSPRNRLVARALAEHGFATLLLDLLTAPEEYDRANVFDIELLAGRLVAATRWSRRDPSVSSLPIGYFGASTGAAAALVAAAELGTEVGAVVSRGGRPDLASDRLAGVRSRVLLIVGGRDEAVFDLNRAALSALPDGAELDVVAGATHLFEEPGALEQVARIACAWFERYLVGAESRPD